VRESASKDLIYVLDTVRTHGKRNPRDVGVQLAVAYLKVRIPAGHDHRLGLLSLEDNLAAYADAKARGLDPEFDDVLWGIELLTERLGTTPLAPVLEPRTRAELAEVAVTLGVGDDWHEPDQVDVTATVTGGSFDNSGAAHLEKNVVLIKDGVPAAQIALATLLSFACDHSQSAEHPEEVKAAMELRDLLDKKMGRTRDAQGRVHE
jgi:hypothetical protein